MDDQTPALPWKWIAVFCAVLLAYGAAASLATRANKQRNGNFPIAGALYHWPDGTTVIPPRPTGIRGDGYIRYYPAKPKDSNFRLIYEGSKQGAQNKAGLPYLHTITTQFSKRDEFSYHPTAVGQVLCDVKLAQAGYLFPCGLSFVHRGARWQLHFALRDVPNTERLHREAVTRLEAFRRGGAHRSNVRFPP